MLEAHVEAGPLQRCPAATPRPGAAGGAVRGLAALLLTLLDGETRVWLAPMRWPGGARRTGCASIPAAPLRRRPRPPSCCCLRSDADAGVWTTLDAGTEEEPQHGATLLLEVPSLHQAGRGSRCSRGPGIDEHAGAGRRRPPRCVLAGAATRARFPRGVDVILCCGDTLAALPRTVAIEEG